MQHWLWIFGEIEGLRWVLQHSRMAFGKSQSASASQIQAGDRAILYVTRGAFHNPTRDRARLAGIVEITAGPRGGRTVTLNDRDFDVFVPFQAVHVLPEREGPEVATFAGKLGFVKNPLVWGQYFRKSPIKLSLRDFKTCEKAVQRALD